MHEIRSLRISHRVERDIEFRQLAWKSSPSRRSCKDAIAECKESLSDEMFFVFLVSLQMFSCRRLHLYSEVLCFFAFRKFLSCPTLFGFSVTSQSTSDQFCWVRLTLTLTLLLSSSVVLFSVEHQFSKKPDQWQFSCSGLSPRNDR